MGRAERLIVGALCLGCLGAPVVALLAGAFDVEEPDWGGGKIITTRMKHDLDVRRFKAPRALSVATKNAGKKPTDGSGALIRTDEVDSREHHSAGTIPVQHHKV